MGVILIDLLTSGTISTVHYCDTLTKLKSVIRRQRSSLLSRGVLVLDDNSRFHTARDTKEHVRRLGWESLDPITAPILPHQTSTFFLQ
uniref:Tc1-like transposase DDE domain-containing protein n=1 Tax=Araneus ventricosus TaxID=182803 RepID=A0A4Y2P932_ARAVE|nr:hypothetical protein AVEN_99006-1 [Araneus ventricosus]